MEKSSAFDLRLPRSDAASLWLGRWQRENPDVTMKWIVLGSGITAMFGDKDECSRCREDAHRSKLI